MISRYDRRNLSLLGRAVQYLAEEIQYLPDTIKQNPIKSFIVGGAILTAIGAAVKNVHDHQVAEEVQPQLYSHTSYEASATTFGIHRTGKIFNGVVQKKTDEDDLAGHLTNTALARYVPVYDKTMGCKVVTLTSDGENLLSHAFGKSVTVAVFNNPAFADGKHECVGLVTPEQKPPAPGV